MGIGGVGETAPTDGLCAAASRGTISKKVDVLKG